MATKRKNPRTTTERIDYQSAGAVRKRPTYTQVISQHSTKIGEVNVTFTVGRITDKEDRQARMLALIDRATEEC